MAQHQAGGPSYVFWDKTDDHPEVCGGVFLAYPLDRSRAMHCEVLIKVSQDFLAELIAGAPWPARRIARLAGSEWNQVSVFSLCNHWKS